MRAVELVATLEVVLRDENIGGSHLSSNHDHDLGFFFDLAAPLDTQVRRCSGQSSRDIERVNLGLCNGDFVVEHNRCHDLGVVQMRKCHSGANVKHGVCLDAEGSEHCVHHVGKNRDWGLLGVGREVILNQGT